MSALPDMSDLVEAIRADWYALPRRFMVGIDPAEVAREEERKAAERAEAAAWGRWYVRGAMDPAYAPLAARDAAVEELLMAGEPSSVHALLKGWLDSYGDPVCTCAHIKGEPAYDPEEDRWRHPVTFQWSWTCPIARHRDYRAALSRATRSPR